MMWCIGRITAEYRDRMYGLLSLYARPYNAREPVVCVDEKSKQLLRQTRAPITVEPGRCAREDCEYRRSGTLNLFVAIEPKGKCRCVEVTARRTKVDFVAFVKHLVETVYATAFMIHRVLGTRGSQTKIPTDRSSSVGWKQDQLRACHRLSKFLLRTGQRPVPGVKV